MIPLEFISARHSAVTEGCVLSCSVAQPFRGSVLIAMEWLPHSTLTLIRSAPPHPLFVCSYSSPWIIVVQSMNSKLSYRSYEYKFSFEDAWIIHVPKFWMNFVWLMHIHSISNIISSNNCRHCCKFSTPADLQLSALGNSKAQCTPMPQPTLGNHQIIQGNGTNVGTVISLQCPGKHKLVGSDMMCVMGPNSTYWTGDSYCQGK